MAMAWWNQQPALPKISGDRLLGVSEGEGSLVIIKKY